MKDLVKATRESVREANRKFYDTVSSDYEKIDGRRSQRLENYIRANLSRIRKDCSGGTLLDLGSGSGFITRVAKGIFPQRVAADISVRILSANRSSFDHAAAADIDSLPFAAGSFDAVTCFSVLHHMYDLKGLVNEVSRVLKPGGIFYSDHDMDAAFNDRFRLPLHLYRKLFNRKAMYRSKCPEITPELYELSEWHEEGIDSAGLVKMIGGAGFDVEAYFHWYGLSPLSDNLFGAKRFSRGWAPLLSLTAKKKNG